MAKATINKIKRQSTKWENIFVNTFDEGLLSKIYEGTYKSKYQKKIQKKIGEVLNRLFSKWTHRWPVLMKKCSMSLITREMQIEISPHISKMAIINKSTNLTSAGEDVKERKLFCTVGGMQTGAAAMESSMGIPQKN